MSQRQPQIADDLDDVSDESGESGRLAEIGIPLSNRQMLAILAAVVIVSIIMWRLRSSSESTDGAQEIERAMEAEIEAEVAIEDDESDDQIEIPTDPTDELEKDQAVLEHLKQSGKFSGAS